MSVVKKSMLKFHAELLLGHQEGGSSFWDVAQAFVDYEAVASDDDSSEEAHEPAAPHSSPTKPVSPKNDPLP